VFRVSTLEAFLAGTALFLGAMYMLYLYRRVIFGTITRDEVRAMLDLTPREKAVFAPLIALVLWMGIYPEPFLAPIRPTVDALVARVASVQKQARATGPEEVIPAKAEIHLSGDRVADQRGPVVVGTTERESQP
jgi:NADH-quinone oxidoreductase subunit M